MSKTKKEVHLRLSDELYEELENNRNINKKSDYYIDLLVRGLKYDEINTKLEHALNLINRIDSKETYNKLLLEQIYSDLDFERKDPKSSVNLQIFKDSIKGKSKYD